MTKKKRTATTYDNEKPIFKLFVAGDKGVGKTTLIKRYVDGTFLEDTQSTIGVDFSLKNMKSSDIDYILQIWDMAGEEKFRSILPNYMAGTHVVILALDYNSDIKKLEEWMKIISDQLEDIFYYLISTKNDIAEPDQNLVDLILTKYTNIIKYYKTSSKSNLNIKELFDDAGMLLLKKFKIN